MSPTAKKAVASRPATAKALPEAKAGSVVKAARVGRVAGTATPTAAAKAPTKKAVKSAVATKKPAALKTKPGGPYADDEKFLGDQRQLLAAERAIYETQASDLKAEADSLAQEREPGDVQFDEESGEGGTVTVDRERDLALSAQALAAVEEIDDALARVDDGTYGACERCHQAIPKPRLRALPFARLCVACKSGGLSRR
ncbi:MAG: TraR/DksA family transcriptional regulator [Acidimicrobiales bacterium]